MPTIETDILIIGGGIAGSALACALRRAGYDIVVVEHRKGPLDTARGDHIQPCNVEAMAHWGVLDRFIGNGAAKRTGHQFRAARGEVLLSATYDELPIAYPYFLVFNHDLIASLFMEIAMESPRFRLLRPFTARNFELGEHGIEALRLTNGDGAETVVKPKLVVGADGTNSPTRAALGFTFDEYQYKHPMVALLGERPAALLPRNFFFRYSGPRGILVIQQRMDNQIKVTLPVGDEGIAFWKNSTPAQRAEILGQRAEILRDFACEVIGFYPVKMVHCHEYAKGNTVLIGDAAHSIHPARGQGLNMGIASLPKLIECLPAPQYINDPARVRGGLQGYREQQKPLHDRMIARNHEAALAMEAQAESGAADAIREYDEQIRLLNFDPNLRRLHLLEAAGYPFGIPVSSERDYQS
jgi:2-polyprenyl-6-methoxyphenol hydroxylase-like FAD-dependent oxidoreductase